MKAWRWLPRPKLPTFGRTTERIELDPWLLRPLFVRDAADALGITVAELVGVLYGSRTFDGPGVTSTHTLADNEASLGFAGAMRAITTTIDPVFSVDRLRVIPSALLLAEDKQFAIDEILEVQDGFAELVTAAKVAARCTPFATSWLQDFGAMRIFEAAFWWTHLAVKQVAGRIAIGEPGTMTVTVQLERLVETSAALVDTPAEHEAFVASIIDQTDVLLRQCLDGYEARRRATEANGVVPWWSPRIALKAFSAEFGVTFVDAAGVDLFEPGRPPLATRS